jgi:hypothetical protein
MQNIKTNTIYTLQESKNTDRNSTQQDRLLLGKEEGK